MKYGIISNIGDLPCESSYWLNSIDLKNHLNTSITTFTPANEKSNKRKSIDNEENEID